jgi:hypothetical protein
LLAKQFRERLEAGLPERTIELKVRFLREITDAQIPGPHHRSRRGLLLANQDTQKSCFADAVRTDKRETCPFCYRKGNFCKEVFRAKGFGEGVCGDQGHSEW